MIIMNVGQRTFWVVQSLIVVGLFGCATKFLEFKGEDLSKNDEYDKLLVVEKLEPEPAVKESPKSDVPPVTTVEKNDVAPVKTALDKKSPQPKKKVESPKPQVNTSVPKADKKPEAKPPKKSSTAVDVIEETQSSNKIPVPIGKAPVFNPFGIGEVITLNVSYLNIEAGNIFMSVKPMVKVQGEEAMHFEARLKTASVFNWFYKVDNLTECYVDPVNLDPFNLEVHAKESKKLSESRSFFDRKTNKARFWEKKVRKGKKPKERNIEWDMFPHAQNVISAMFYIRTIDHQVGKVFEFPVADEGKNIMVKGTVLAKEPVATKLGSIEAYKMKMEFTVNGTFKPVGDVFIWVGADERKLLTKIEIEIKIGSFIAKISDYQPGKKIVAPVK